MKKEGRNWQNELEGGGSSSYSGDSTASGTLTAAAASAAENVAERRRGRRRDSRWCLSSRNVCSVFGLDVLSGREGGGRGPRGGTGPAGQSAAAVSRRQISCPARLCVHRLPRPSASVRSCPSPSLPPSLTRSSASPSFGRSTAHSLTSSVRPSLPSFPPSPARPAPSSLTACRLPACQPVGDVLYALTVSLAVPDGLPACLPATPACRRRGPFFKGRSAQGTTKVDATESFAGWIQRIAPCLIENEEKDGTISTAVQLWASMSYAIIFRPSLSPCLKKLKHQEALFWFRADTRRTACFF